MQVLFFFHRGYLPFLATSSTLSLPPSCSTILTYLHVEPSTRPNVQEVVEEEEEEEEEEEDLFLFFFFIFFFLSLFIIVSLSVSNLQVCTCNLRNFFSITR